jgi:hypothetical protein
VQQQLATRIFSATALEEGRMAHDERLTHRPTATLFHPLVYRAMIALAALLAASVWGFFADNSTGYLLAVVSGFIFMVVALPYQLWRVRRHGHDPRLDGQKSRPLSEWLASDFDAWQERLRGWDVVAGSLLPIMACAFGMLAFAIMFRFMMPG